MHKCAHNARTLFTYQWASCAAMFWIIFEFARFRLAKTKRVRRLLSRSPKSSQFAIPPMAKSQVRQLSPLSPCETSPCFFGDPIKRSLRGADTNAFMSCIYPHPKDIYPRRELNTAKLSFCAAKLRTFSDICKKNRQILAKWRFFYGVAKPEYRRR